MALNQQVTCFTNYIYYIFIILNRLQWGELYHNSAKVYLDSTYIANALQYH